MKQAYFAGGCFWCITPMFKVYGASRVTCGYSGGEETRPAYEEVKHQKTGHRETVCVEYDPQIVSYRTLLEIFLENIDPYDAEGQYIDRGHSYTTAVYYQDSEEQQLAEEACRAMEQQSGKTVAVSIEPFRSFYEAEEYHQDYYLKHPEAFEKELYESGRKTKIKVYGTATCPDCSYLDAQLENRPEFEKIDILEHVHTLKEFLRLRDSNSAFEEARAGGFVGIPCFLLADGTVTLVPEDVGLRSRPAGDAPACRLDGSGC